MWIFSRARNNRPATLLRELYTRYLIVIVALIVLVGLAQFQSIHDGLYTTGVNSLNYAINDALSEPYVVHQIKSNKFLKLAPRLLNLLAIRGINVRILGPQHQLLGERSSKYDPATLVPFVSDQVLQKNANTVLSSVPFPVSLFAQEISNQIVLYAKVGDHSAKGYIEIGFNESLFNPVLYQQALNFLIISIIVTLLAMALLIPVVRAPLLPLHHLINTAMRIRSGAFQERLPILGPSETVRLAEVINDTLDKLAEAMQREQAATNRMKQFVSDASHELRTPLTAVRGFTDVLLRRVESYYRSYAVFHESSEEDGERDEEMQGIMLPPEQFEDTRHALIAMQRETARLEGLVKDLLQLARLDGGVQPHLEEVDLANLLKELQPQFDMLAERREIIYDLNSAIAYCDRSMVQQIAYNLVANAIQYTDKTHGQIRIIVTPLEYKKARLTIKDNGPGISKDQLNKIFDRFYRASGARERAPGGAGLGLAIVAEIVRLHNGHIDVFSEWGHGTEMRVDL